MKITLTGSLGHISKPLAQILAQQGHQLTIISSNPKRKKDIEALGVKAAIGTMEDVAFLTEAFKDADVVYAMETLGHGAFFNQQLDYTSAIQKIGINYKQAIERSSVKRVVHLSSIGAHTDKGNGMLASHYEVEQTLNALPPDVAITFMRPVGFYYNLLSFIPGIKMQNAIITNYGDLKEPWVSPTDIAAAIAEEIVIPFSGRKIRYVASEELTCDEVAGILGEAIGKPDLKWKVISDEELLNALTAAGMNPSIARGYMEMNAGRRSGVLYEDYYKHRPVLGKTKLKDYAKEFAAAYYQQ